MEVKPGGQPYTQREAANQLFKYLKQVPAEQLDRRFVIGLTLCGHLLNVYVYDRSGILGMGSAVDIHSESLAFTMPTGAKLISTIGTCRIRTDHSRPQHP